MKYLSNSQNKKGFTLIEVIISLSIFIIVMTVSAGAVLSIVDGNRKTKAIKSVMDNLSFALETVSRNARVGTNFACDLEGLVTTACPTESAAFSFLDSYDTNTPKRRIGYQFATVDGGQTYQLFQYINGQNAVALTSPETNISRGRFYIYLASGALRTQPRVIIAMKGTSGMRKLQTDFLLQTSVTQRKVE